VDPGSEMTLLPPTIADPSSTTEPPILPPLLTPEEREAQSLQFLADYMVRPALRRQIAQRKLFGELEVVIEQQRAEYESDDSILSPGAMADPPELAALTAQEGMSVDQTPLMSQFDADDEEVGKSYVGGSGGRQSSFVQLVFGNKLGPFQTQVTEDAEGNRYLLWVVQATVARPEKPTGNEDQSLWEGVMAYEDEGVEDEVRRVWKQVQARELARAEAQRLGDEAREAGKSLIATFSDRPDIKVETPTRFSWLTSSGQGQAARVTYSEVPGVEWAGGEFMRTVFGLDASGIGVAMNQPQTFAYAIQVESFQWLGTQTDADGNRMAVTPQVAWTQFVALPMAERNRKVAQAASSDLQGVATAWLEGIKTDAGLKWLTQPRRSSR